MIQQMNSSLPAKRILLSELLKMQEPHYVGRDDRKYLLEKPEIELIESILKNHGVADIKLPLLLIGDASMEQSTWRIEGETECMVIMEILGRKPSERKDKIFLYAAHMSIIRRKLPTTTALMFLP